MKNLISLVAVIGGLWLLYLGYERRQSLAGKADRSLADVGQKIDGEGHVTDEVMYFAAGAVLVASGALGLGVVRK